MRFLRFIGRVLTSWKVWVFTAIALSLAGLVGWFLRRDKFADGNY
jgi:hypothetical protein